jgi:hypothetical protein
MDMSHVASRASPHPGLVMVMVMVTRLWPVGGYLVRGQPLAVEEELCDELELESQINKHDHVIC